MTRTALAVSPHLDDAVFSCGGTLALLARRGWRVVMATVFTATVPDPQGFALACQLDKGLPPEADYMALRRAEDVASASALGIETPVHLPFREAPHRGYHSAAALFAETDAADAIVPALIPALGDLLARVSPEIILAPQGVGGHVDHIQVVRAIRGIAPGPPILWWRDYPYTVRTPEPKQPLAALFAALETHDIALDRPAEQAKETACAAYATQIGFQFGGRERLAARLREEGGVERFRVGGFLPVGVPGVARA